jgi:hypothetical protein
VQVTGDTLEVAVAEGALGEVEVEVTLPDGRRLVRPFRPSR